MDIDKLFNENAFKNVDKNLLNSFKKLSQDIKGKNFDETLDLVIKFSESMPKEKSISEDDRNAMIMAIINSLNQDERCQFKNMLEMFEKR